LVAGDDDLPAEDVGPWVKDKHALLCEYIHMSRWVRAKWTTPLGAGATYIELFCGTGRARIRDTGEYVDGSCIAAWKESVAGGKPFSQMYIGDANEERRELAITRLKRLNAPVRSIDGPAVVAAGRLQAQLDPHGLHFAFLDPYNLEALDFGIIKALSIYEHIDILVHISQMDLQRNVGRNLGPDSAFDAFAPGWRSAVSASQSHRPIRKDVFLYWQKLVEDLGVWTSAEMKLITGPTKQPLYRLLLAAKHDLAHKFWKAVAKHDQLSFDL
jgi:three-Cys-motif partner protein